MGKATMDNIQASYKCLELLVRHYGEKYTPAQLLLYTNDFMEMFAQKAPVSIAEAELQDKQDNEFSDALLGLLQKAPPQETSLHYDKLANALNLLCEKLSVLLPKLESLCLSDPASPAHPQE